jgi:hypothetical protein
VARKSLGRFRFCTRRTRRRFSACPSLCLSVFHHLMTILLHGSHFLRRWHGEGFALTRGPWNRRYTAALVVIDVGWRLSIPTFGTPLGAGLWG